MTLHQNRLYIAKGFQNLLHMNHSEFKFKHDCERAKIKTCRFEMQFIHARHQSTKL